jgi:cell division protein FtsI/penicillin-binding protein 2
MQKTVLTGTASKSFARFKKDAVLSRLNIGGKTGSINNNAERLKYDWFVGFAEEKTGSKKIVLSVLVVHQDYIGPRAAQYSKMAIKEYFKNYYATKNDSKKKAAAL